MVSLSVPPLGDRAAQVLVGATGLRRQTHVVGALAEEGYEVGVVERPGDLVDWILRFPPDVAILDACGDPELAFELLGELRTIDPLHILPVIVVADWPLEEDVVRALRAGADDVVSHPDRHLELLARVAAQVRNRRDRDLLRTVQRERIQLLDHAYTDPLTGVGNRRAADRALERCANGVSSLLLLVIDVDHFKKVNDTWGHVVGDEVLRSIARCLRHAARDDDEVARYGGEEFVVLIRDAPPQSHRAIGKRFLRSLRRMTLPPELGPPRVTASVGAVSWHRPEAADGVDPPPSEHLVRTADRALYQAKRSGRDALVMVHAHLPDEPLLVASSDSLA
jgi:diguanylate cyclase (GGDEF)-like protein